MTHRRTKPAASSTGSSQETVTLKEQVATLTQGWQRTQADFDNFRRRSQAEQADRAGYELGRALLTLTPVAENLRRAMTQFTTLSAPTTEQLAAWATGIQSIARQFDQALTAAGLVPIEPQPGEPFNPHEHEALTHQPHVNHSVDTVTQVVERGYRVGNRVLVPAKVIVSSGREERKV